MGIETFVNPVNSGIIWVTKNVSLKPNPLSLERDNHYPPK